MVETDRCARASVLTNARAVRSLRLAASRRRLVEAGDGRDFAILLRSSVIATAQQGLWADQSSICVINLVDAGYRPDRAPINTYC